jgi:hypothetical protein
MGNVHHERGVTDVNHIIKCWGCYEEKEINMNWVSIDMEGQMMMSNCVGDVERTTNNNDNEHEWELGNIRCWYDAKDVDPKLGRGYAWY